MIPELPPTVSDEDRIQFYDTLFGNLSDQSSIHTNWHTHRQNPSTCWICDMVTLGTKVLDLWEKNLSKSPLDTETELRSEDDSDPEIENDNFEERDVDLDDGKDYVPEYDVEDDES